MLDQELTPGKRADASDFWPQGVKLPRPDGKFTAVFFAHPDCPCTSASMEQLNDVAAHLGSQLGIIVIFSKPGGTAREIRDSKTWQMATGIPGATVLFDPGAKETERFGARVSGQTLLYNPSGRLLFNGGITAGRGHEGSNPGSDLVAAQVQAIPPATKVAAYPVFGCALHDPGVRNEDDPAWNAR